VTRLTIFNATLVQVSALSVSGLDRETSADQSFTMIDGEPILLGRGLKGAAVSMAQRFFASPLPRSITESKDVRTSLHRSSWEFSNTRLSAGQGRRLDVRAGVGIRQKTGARAEGVLFDRETVPGGTTWDFSVQVNWQTVHDATEDPSTVEGILGYVLLRHWAEARCWLGASVARGLGWCRLDDLKCYRLDEVSYSSWLKDGRPRVPAHVASIAVPTASPTRSWCFRSRDINLTFGKYIPDVTTGQWGLDMLAVGAHSLDAGNQDVPLGSRWAVPAWTTALPSGPIHTDRSFLMEGLSPLLPGSSLRGPLRHTFSRGKQKAGVSVTDPHTVQGKVDSTDPAAQVFGTVDQSSRVLICDARANSGWCATRLHMHAEDEFTAGSFESAKRDAVRLLEAEFPVRVLVEGPDEASVAPLCQSIDWMLKIGALGHLPVGGHKTRGSGWGRWQMRTPLWDPSADVVASASVAAPANPQSDPSLSRPEPLAVAPQRPRVPPMATRTDKHVLVVPFASDAPEPMTLGAAFQLAGQALTGVKAGPPTGWWVEPTIDFSVQSAPNTFGWGPPPESQHSLRIDEVIVFAPTACWRIARTAEGCRGVMVCECKADASGAEPVTRIQAWVIPLGPRLTSRFMGVAIPQDTTEMIQWAAGEGVIGFTLVRKGEV